MTLNLYFKKDEMCFLSRNAPKSRNRIFASISKTIVLLILMLAPGVNAAVCQEIIHPKVKWKYKTQGTIRAAPLIDQDRLYISSADGYLYALDKQSGQLIWKFNGHGSMSAPVVTDELVIVVSRDKNVYAVKKRDGQLRWKIELSQDLAGYMEWEYFMAAPVLHENKVLVASGDGRLYSLDAATGKQHWRFDAKARLRATPLIDGSTVYLPSNNGFVHVINAASGVELWRFETEGASLDHSQGFDRTCIFTKPILKYNLLIFGSRDGKTYAVDVRSRAKKWEFTYGSTWAMSVATDGENVFTGWSTNNIFSAIDLRSGVEKWKYECGSVVYSTADVRGEQVIVGSADGYLYGFDKRTGTKAWQFDSGAEVHSSPVSDEDGIYFGSDNGYIYALEEGGMVYRAVYQPLVDDYPHYPVINPKVAPYLRGRGFHQLDSAGLSQFISARIQDKARSVIVFAYDAIPSDIVGADPENGLIRQYLNMGGKIVWFGGVPNRFAFDTKGRMLGVQGVQVAERMLDVKFVTPEESGNYFSRSTQDGLNMGLPPWLKTTHASVGRGVTALAHDEYGRISAWLKKFSPQSGSGFISCRTWAWDVDIRERDLALIHALALDGLE